MSTLSGGPSADQAIVYSYDEATNSLKVVGGNTTVTDVAGKKSLDVNVTSLTLSSSDDSVETRSQPMKTAIDEASSTVTYIGEATTGTTTSSSNWRIKRLTQSGSVLIIEWADGNGNFDNIWDNRTSLTYS